jgi:nucleoside-diphosphate-sugar epimerase
MILITGGLGFIGTATVQALLELGGRVHAHPATSGADP